MAVEALPRVTYSNVAADFTPQAEAALQKFADAGMHLVKSTDPIENWGIK